MPVPSGARYRWWTLQQAMMAPDAPRYWWVTGIVALFVVVPALDLMAWLRDAAIRARTGEK